MTSKGIYFWDILALLMHNKAGGLFGLFKLHLSQPIYQYVQHKVQNDLKYN